NVDPMISLLESQGAIKVVADTRTPEGTRAVFGGPYPAAVLYAPKAFIDKNPRTTQALATALVRGLQWMAGHTAEEIAGVMPDENALTVLKAFDADVANARIDTGATYTDAFVDTAPSGRCPSVHPSARRR